MTMLKKERRVNPPEKVPLIAKNRTVMTVITKLCVMEKMKMLNEMEVKCLK